MWFFFFSSRRRHTRCGRDWSSDVCSSDLYRPVYVAERGVNLPALGFYVFAVPLAFGPIRPWSLRPVTALAGTLCVLPLFALVRRTTGRTDAALFAAAFLACSSWAVSVSRLSF